MARAMSWSGGYETAARLTPGVRPEAVAGVALAIFAVLLVLNLAGILVILGDVAGFRQIARMFMFDVEANFATLFNFLLLVGISATAALLAVRAFDVGDRWRYHWAGLAALLLLMAYDEAALMHEMLSPYAKRFIAAEGFLYFAWVVPGAIFVLGIGLTYLRFVLVLPRRVAMLTFLGGALYVGGALGMEVLGARLAWEGGYKTLEYQLIATTEESLEMLGLIAFGYGLLRLLAGADGRLRLPARARPPA